LFVIEGGKEERGRGKAHIRNPFKPVTVNGRFFRGVGVAKQPWGGRRKEGGELDSGSIVPRKEGKPETPYKGGNILKKEKLGLSQYRKNKGKER